MQRRTMLALSLLLGLIISNPGAALAASKCGEQQITPARLNQILTGGESANILLLDARSRQNFFAGTIPTAISTAKLQDMIDAAHQDSNDATVIVVTRDGLADGPLREWIEQLCEKDVKILILQGGIRGWQAQGFALEKPKDRLIAPGEVTFVIPRGLCEMNAPVQQYN